MRYTSLGSFCGVSGADIGSHHPPVTAYCIWNANAGVRLQGYNAQKASFSRTINVKVRKMS